MAEPAFNQVTFPAVVAHRGASSTQPENTISSFQAAFHVGAPLVELDVRLSADGVAVVIHDPDVSRTTDGSGWVHEMTFEQLRTLNAGTPERPEPIPTLREVLEVARGRGGVVVEIKNIPGEPAYEQEGESIVEAAVAEVEAVAFDGPIVIISFNPRSILAAKALAPATPTGFLFTHALDPETALSLVLGGGHAFAFPGYRVIVSTDRRFVERAHSEGLRVGTWTVDDRQTFRALLDRDVDAIASNDPAMGLEVLSRWRVTGPGPSRRA
jgi:glycerophosphoryl diester phosphodiesterase